MKAVQAFGIWKNAKAPSVSGRFRNAMIKALLLSAFLSPCTHLTPAVAHDRAEGPVVQTAECVVRGLVRDGVSVFLWIPYAAKVRQLQGTPNADGPYVTGSGGTRPIVDGTIVPVVPDAAITTGRFNRMPIMGGSTHDDGTFFNEVQRAQHSHWVIIATIIDRTSGKPIGESKLGGPELEFDDPVRCKAIIDKAHPTPTDRAATVLTCRKVQGEAIRPDFY